MPYASRLSERPFSWAECQKIVQTNDLEGFARSKRQTEQYMAHKELLRVMDSTIFKYLLTNSLGWAAEKQVNGIMDADIKIASSGDEIFSNPTDLKIIYNDFPYYFEENVAHLCIWSKQPIPSDPKSSVGDLSVETRATIEQYIYQTFVEYAGIPRENLLWFRNWDSLQSVREISHVHVIIRYISNEQLDLLLGTAGIPLC